MAQPASRIRLANTGNELLYVHVTGHAPMLPDWACGFWQSKLRYASQKELETLVDEYCRCIKLSRIYVAIVWGDLLLFIQEAKGTRFIKKIRAITELIDAAN